MNRSPVGVRVIIRCAFCTKAYEVRPCEAERSKFCTKKCKNDFLVGKPSWNSGKVGVQTAWNKGISPSEETKRKLSARNKGQVSNRKGAVISAETRRKQSLAKLGKPRPDMRGENSPHWTGTRSANLLDRGRVEYRLWRTAVFQRDDYTCTTCGQRGGYLEADHILPFALYPAQRFDVDNGRTMCEPCHKKTITYGGSFLGIKPFDSQYACEGVIGQ